MTGQPVPRTDAEERAYQQGAADTHARYESMQEQAHAWLTGVLELVGKWERIAQVDAGLPNGTLHRQHAAEIRKALSLGSVKIEAPAPEETEACEDRDPSTGLLCTRGAGHPGGHLAEPNGAEW